MHIKQLKDSWKVIRDELDNLPMDVFISDKPRPTGEWQGSPIVQKIVNDYSNGKFGWLKGGQEHVQEEWISWPLIWNGKWFMETRQNVQKRLIYSHVLTE